MTFALLLFGLAFVLQQTPNLEQLRWSHRVLLLFAQDEHDEQLVAQRAILERAAPELQERDLKVFEMTGTDVRSRDLRRKFDRSEAGFLVVLIGKDGSDKLRRSKPVSAGELFQLIDSMPMRREEMQQRK